MDDNPNDGQRTNLLSLPASEYQELQTEQAFAKFNRVDKRKQRDREDRRDD